MSEVNIKEPTIAHVLNHLLTKTQKNVLNWDYSPESWGCGGEIYYAPKLTLRTANLFVSIVEEKRRYGFLWLQEKTIYQVTLYRYSNGRYVNDSDISEWITDGQLKLACEELFHLAESKLHAEEVARKKDTIDTALAL